MKQRIKIQQPQIVTATFRDITEPVPSFEEQVSQKIDKQANEIGNYTIPIILMLTGLIILISPLVFNKVEASPKCPIIQQIK